MHQALQGWWSLPLQVTKSKPSRALQLPHCPFMGALGGGETCGPTGCRGDGLGQQE